MKTLMFLLLLGICLYGGEAVIHSLKYFYTGSTELPNFPEFAAVGMVDDQQFEYYDSITGRAQVKLDWLVKYIADKDPQYLDRHTQIFMGTQPNYKPNIEILKTRFNQTGGVHIYQNMYGCEWDDQTGELSGFYQIGYDGEDLQVWDINTNTWVAVKQQGVIAVQRWNSDKAELEQRKNYLNNICPEWLKKYVDYGRSSLMRKVLPSVSLLQKSSSSPVTCHATGFYPNRAELVWMKDKVELHEGVNKGEILTNNDGTFQMSVDLKLSSIKPEDWEMYKCVFQLSGEEDIVTKLDRGVIRTNEGFPVGAVVGGVIGVLLLLTVCISTVVFFKKRNNGFKRADGSDSSSSSTEDSGAKKEPGEEQKMINSSA